MAPAARAVRAERAAAKAARAARAARAAAKAAAAAEAEAAAVAAAAAAAAAAVGIGRGNLCAKVRGPVVVAAVVAVAVAVAAPVATARLEWRGCAHCHETICCAVAALPHLGDVAWFGTAVVLDKDRAGVPSVKFCPDHQVAALSWSAELR